MTTLAICFLPNKVLIKQNKNLHIWQPKDNSDNRTYSFTSFPVTDQIVH